MFDSNRTFRIRDPAWLSCRARNAARRPLFIAVIAACVVALAVLSLILAPRHRRRPGPMPSTAIIKVDTVPLVQALTVSKSRVESADSALVIVRRQVLAATATPKIDSLDPKLLKRHDSLTNVLTELQGLIGKVETAPLPTSYRALAASPALISNPQIVALLDSLRDVERDRESLGSAGGADPRFVTLTSRLTEIGRSIEAVAAERRDSLRSTITMITAPSKQVVEERAAAPDTMPWVAERDSALSAVGTATVDLAAARRQLADNRREIEAAQEISVISAGPFAMVVAAAIFGIAIGFAGALRSEFRAPTVADGPELERVTGARVMATVIPVPRTSELERRQANRVAPKYLDTKADSYQLAYLHVEQSVATPDVVAIIGDDADVSAIVAMNLAAIAAEDARSVLVIDAAGRSAAIRSLLPVSGSGDLSEIIANSRSWVDATAHVSVGRDKLIDVVTGARAAAPAALIELLNRDKQRLGKYYDTVFVVGGLDLVPSLVDDHSVGGTVITATVGRTPLAEVVRATNALREKTRQVFGVVLWDGPPPRLAARAQRRTGGDRKATPPPLASPQPSVT
jgi:Mrp family chromosome partitioning ATPase